MTSHIYRDVILEEHVRLFRGAMGAEFLFMDDNARPHRANIVDECLHSEDITRIDWPAYSPDLNPIEHLCSASFLWRTSSHMHPAAAISGVDAWSALDLPRNPLTPRNIFLLTGGWNQRCKSVTLIPEQRQRKNGGRHADPSKGA
ncbi:DDE_3 domain-containing protein [Trichonephila clavipes]|uniref:DDE_3 domain-containing protein n=1 Tax=Trichonephila clavipes TaxID=2585209 RepID=A0A8X6SFN3_TRICX|nr:DDE_3 domain-containing protein [Trichonephila clavipes]